MQTVEELRDILAALQHENQGLKASAALTDLMLAGIDTLLGIDGGNDPFSIVFQSLERILTHDDAVALIFESEKTTQAERLVCVSSTVSAQVGQRHQPCALLRRVLKGRVVSGLSGAASPLCSQEKRAALYLPLQVGEAKGVIVLWRNDGEPAFGRHDIELGRRFAPLTNQALSMRDHARTEEKNRQLRVLSSELERQAHYDPLTKLPNRTKIGLVIDDLIGTKPEAPPFAVAFIDLNKFKQINDYYGHDIGDKLLCAVAGKLSDSVGEDDHVARISGDEFLIVLTAETTRTSLMYILDQVLEAVVTDYLVDGFAIDVSASIGVSRFPQDGQDQETLQRAADGAMFRSKNSEEQRIVFFNSEMAREISEKKALEARLRRAIKKKSFAPFFQPKINIRTGLLQGFEVLLRWKDESGNLHAPGRFMTVAEELGLTDDIMCITAQQVVSHMPTLVGRFGDSFKISLNVTPSQVRKQRFLEVMLSIMSEANAAGRLVFEITEDEALDIEYFAEIVQPQLDNHGILVSIDDFGKGYSNLAQLSTMDAYELKIDRDMIVDIDRDPLKQKIVLMIDTIAKQSGRVTVAEGVETDAELEYLLAHTQIDVVQGYIFAKPMGISDLINWSLDANADPVRKVAT